MLGNVALTIKAIAIKCLLLKRYIDWEASSFPVMWVLHHKPMCQNPIYYPYYTLCCEMYPAVPLILFYHSCFSEKRPCYIFFQSTFYSCLAWLFLVRLYELNGETMYSVIHTCNHKVGTHNNKFGKIIFLWYTIHSILENKLNVA